MKLAAISVLAACAAATPPVNHDHRRGGDLMIEVGSRYARIFREVAAGDWQLASYDLHEVREVFEDDLLPRTWDDNPTMKHEAHDFLAGPLTQFESAARVHDRADCSRSFIAATKACNGCHVAGHVAFIEIGSDGALRSEP